MGANFPSATPCSHSCIVLSIWLEFACFMSVSCIRSLSCSPGNHGKSSQGKDKYSKTAFCNDPDLRLLSDCNPTCLIPLRMKIFFFSVSFPQSVSPDISISMYSQQPECLRLKILVEEKGTSTAAGQERGFRDFRHLMLSPGIERDGHDKP